MHVWFRQQEFTPGFEQGGEGSKHIVLVGDFMRHPEDQNHIYLPGDWQVFC
jgi:hypothetical protein